MTRREKIKIFGLTLLTLLAYPLIALSCLGSKEGRYYKLEDLLFQALRKRDYKKATSLAHEYLRLSKRDKGWNYGNAVHDSHQALGLVSLKQGNLTESRKHLLLAGKTPGSPQLNTFGPHMYLARELLEAGEKDVVLKYLELVRRFWADEKGKDDPESKYLARAHGENLDYWIKQIEADEIPQGRWWHSIYDTPGSKVLLSFSRVIVLMMIVEASVAVVIADRWGMGSALFCSTVPAIVGLILNWPGYNNMKLAWAKHYRATQPIEEYVDGVPARYLLGKAVTQYRQIFLLLIIPGFVTDVVACLLLFRVYKTHWTLRRNGLQYKTSITINI